MTCREDCEMLVSDKDTFGVLCPRIFEKELEEKISFIRSMPRLVDVDEVATILETDWYMQYYL